MTIRRVTVDHGILTDTIEELRQGGFARTERFALWLGRRTESQVVVSAPYTPDYEASSDYFHVNREAMVRLMAHLRAYGLMIGAQLHTHPAEAFHSLADDRWAIVRHVGAVSIVLPDFGRSTTRENFLDEAKVFALSQRNEWTEIPRRELHRFVEIIP